MYWDTCLCATFLYVHESLCPRVIVPTCHCALVSLSPRVIVPTCQCALVSLCPHTTEPSIKNRMTNDIVPTFHCVGTMGHGHNGTWAQRYVGTMVRGHNNMWAKWYVGTMVRGHNEACAKWHVGTVRPGHNGTWTHQTDLRLGSCNDAQNKKRKSVHKRVLS